VGSLVIIKIKRKFTLLNAALRQFRSTKLFNRVKGDEEPMSRYLTITNSSSVRFGERKGVFRTQSKLGRVTLNFILVALICAAGVFYIFEVNNSATKGYEIRGLETKLNELRKENETLRIQAAELKSMYKIEEKTKDLNMVAPKDVSYLNLPGDVAMK